MHTRGPPGELSSGRVLLTSRLIDNKGCEIQLYFPENLKYATTAIPISASNVKISKDGFSAEV